MGMKLVKSTLELDMVRVTIWLITVDVVVMVERGVSAARYVE